MATAAANHSSDLRSSLEAHDAAFTQLLGLIPAKYYIAVDDEEVRMGLHRQLIAR